MLRALLAGLLLGGWLGWLSPALAAAGPPRLHLAVELDPARGELQVEAVLRAPEAGYRFVLHESLQPQSASADGRALALRAAGSRGALRAWRVDVPAGAELPSVVDVLAASGVVESKGAARRAIAEGGAYLNNQRVNDPNAMVADGDLLAGEYLILRRGKRTVGAVRVLR